MFYKCLRSLYVVYKTKHNTTGKFVFVLDAAIWLARKFAQLAGNTFLIK